MRQTHVYVKTEGAGKFNQIISTKGDRRKTKTKDDRRTKTAKNILDKQDKNIDILFVPDCACGRVLKTIS